MCATKLVEYQEPQTLDCDNPSCGYQEPISGSITQDMIGTLCPKCGESLLTQEDFDDTMEIIEAMKDYGDVIKNMSEEELSEFNKDLVLPEAISEDDVLELGMKVHNGKIEQRVKIIKKQN